MGGGQGSGSGEQGSEKEQEVKETPGHTANDFTVWSAYQVGNQIEITCRVGKGPERTWKFPVES